MDLVKKRISSKHISVQHSGVLEAKANQIILLESLQGTAYVASSSLKYVNSIPKLILEIGKGTKPSLLLEAVLDLYEKNTIEPHPLIAVYEQQKQLLSLILSKLCIRKLMDQHWQFYKHVLYSKDYASQILVLNHVQSLKDTSGLVADILVDVLVQNKQVVGDLVQEQVLRIMSGMDISERMAHGLLARLVYCWKFQETICELSLSILEKNTKSFSEIYYKNLLVVASLILLDFPSCNPLIEMLDLAVDHLTSSSIVKLSILSILTILMIPETSFGKQYRKKAFDLLVKIETIHQLNDQKTAIEITPTNVVYECITQLSLSYPFVDDANSMHYFTNIPGLKSILYIANLFESRSEQRYQIMNEFNEDIMNFRQQDMLKILSVYLYFIKKEKHVHFILAKCIPALVKFNDSFITNACLQITLSFLKPQEFVSNLEFIGLEAITNIWKIQPRVWNHIKVYIANWAARFKQSEGAGRVKSKEVKDRENDLEKVVCLVIYNFCLHNPHINGADLMPIIISLLKTPNVQEFGKTRDLSEFGTGKVLSAFLLCIEAEISTTRAAWNVVFKKYFESLNENSFIVIYENICRFFGLVAKKTDETDKSMNFRSEILNDYLVPLLKHSNYNVRNYALLALMEFPSEDTEMFMVNPIEYMDEAISNNLPGSYKSFFTKRIEYEAQNMSRPVFKGISMEFGAKATKRDLQSKASETIDISTLEGISVDLHLVLQKSSNNILRQGLVRTYILTLAIVLFYPPKQNTIEEAIQYVDYFANLIVKEINMSYSTLSFIDVIEGCTAFWQKLIGNLLKLSDDESVVKAYLEEYCSGLMARIEQSQVPSSTSVLLMFLSGMMIAISQLETIPSSVFVDRVIENLFQLLTTKGFSSEVQSNTIVGLAYIATSLSTVDFNTLNRIWNECMKNSDKFNFGFCAAKLLLMYMVNKESTAQEYFDCFLKKFFDQSTGWVSNGAAIGFSILLKDIQEIDSGYFTRVQKVVEHAKNVLMSDSIVDKKLILTSCWIITMGWKGFIGEDQLESLIENSVRFANKDNEIEYLLITAKTRLMIWMSNSDSQLTSVSDTIIKSIERENEHGKLAHTQSLRILYGGDYSFSGVCFHPVLSLKDNLALVHSLIAVLKEAQTSPKVVRSLGWAIGNCLDKSFIMITGNSFLTNYQSDPVDYKRLNPEKSFLKSVYDRLIHCINEKQEKESLDLLTVLGDVKGSLPPVEWKVILNYVNRLPQGPLKCFQFTSNQVGRNSAKSLTTKFLELFEKLSITGHLDVVASDMGIGRLLDLAGFNNTPGLISMNQFITIIQSVVPKLGYKSQYASGFYNLIGTKIRSYEYKASTNYEILEALLINILTEMKDIALTNSSISIIQSIVIGLGNSPPSRNKLMTLAKTAPLTGSWIVGFLMEYDLSLHSAFLDILIDVSDRGEYQTSCALSVLGSVCRLNLIPQDVQKMMIRIIDTMIILNSKNSPKQLEYFWLYVVLGFSYASNAGVGFDLYGDISWPLIASAGLLSLKSCKASNETLENRLIALYSQLDLSKQSTVSKHIKYLIDQ